MTLVTSKENKVTKDKNCKNVPHSETTEVILVNQNVVNNDYQANLRVLCTFVPHNVSVNYLKFH